MSPIPLYFNKHFPKPRKMIASCYICTMCFAHPIYMLIFTQFTYMIHYMVWHNTFPSVDRAYHHVSYLSCSGGILGWSNMWTAMNMQQSTVQISLTHADFLWMHVHSLDYSNLCFLTFTVEKIQDTQTSENSSLICQNCFQYLLSLKQLRRDARESCQKKWYLCHWTHVGSCVGSSRTVNSASSNLLAPFA